MVSEQLKDGTSPAFLLSGMISTAAFTDRHIRISCCSVLHVRAVEGITKRQAESSDEEGGDQEGSGDKKQGGGDDDDDNGDGEQGVEGRGGAPGVDAGKKTGAEQSNAQDGATSADETNFLESGEQF